MSGVRIHSINDIRLLLHDFHDPTEDCGPVYLTGITIPFGITQAEAPDPEQIEFSEQDHITARVVWSIIATSTPDDTLTTQQKQTL